MKLLIGNFKGPKGEQGNEGKKGDNGDKGEKGERGSRWTSGTAITGTSTTETIFADSGITDAKIDDYYINTTTGNLYQCTASGAADTAKWVYIGNFKGPKGNDGPAGSISDINDQIPTYEESTQFENIESGETVKIAFGKLKKALSVFIVHHTQKATAAILGHVKLSNSAAITKAGEYALDAIEKNAAIEGTLANLINSLNSNMNTKISAENFSYNWVAAGADYVCTIHRAGLLMIKRGTAAKLCAINPEGVVTIALEYGNESELYFAQDITIEPIPPDNDWHKVMLHNNARSGIYVFRLSI